MRIKNSDDIFLKAIRLPDAEYRPSEIAAKLGTNKRHILKLIAKGAPFRKETGGKGTNGRTWVNGKQFMKWIAEVNKEMRLKKEIRGISAGMVFRSIRLLDMEYRPAELADEIGASRKQIIRFIELGCPSRKEKNGHHWLHGLSFAKWLCDYSPKRNKEKTAYLENEAWCTTCMAKVTFSETRRLDRAIYGECPKGHKVVRFYSSKSKSTKKGK